MRGKRSKGRTSSHVRCKRRVEKEDFLFKDLEGTARRREEKPRNTVSWNLKGRAYQDDFEGKEG